MAKTAILVDGSFYLKMAKKHWGEKTPQVHEEMRIQSDSVEDLSGGPLDDADDSPDDYQEMEMR